MPPQPTEGCTSDAASGGNGTGIGSELLISVTRSGRPQVLRCASQGELVPIPGTPYLWAELRWAARAEGVVHLTDLLLRRLRIGLLLPSGGVHLLPQVKGVVGAELGWDEGRWRQEVADYLAAWERCHSPKGEEKREDRQRKCLHVDFGAIPLCQENLRSNYAQFIPSSDVKTNRNQHFGFSHPVTNGLI